MIKDELKCYHSRISLEENPLGLLVNVTRNFRTGKIQDVSVSKEIVCLKSFINENLRFDIDNVKYSYWLPLYFGNIDNSNKHYQQFIKLLKHSISMMSTKSTR